MSPPSSPTPIKRSPSVKDPLYSRCATMAANDEVSPSSNYGTMQSYFPVSASRVNHTLSAALRKLVNDTAYDWDVHTDGVAFAPGINVQASTKNVRSSYCTASVRLDLRGIILSPVISRLFEMVLLEICSDALYIQIRCSLDSRR